MNNIICISGPSGVGKTTISNLISSVLDVNSCVIISGDDSHRWERNDKMWEVVTHLNPEANNLEKEFDDLVRLKNNRHINRKKYNHKSGFFDPVTKIQPKKNIIYEGLHALYSDKIRNISDLKIYVDTDEELKIAWKINRDIKKRGYSEKEIINTIQRRMVDEEKYILPQKQFADVIVKFTFQGIEVNFEYEIINSIYEDLFKQIKEFYQLKKEFIKVCNMLAQNNELVQNKGGNVSFKYGDKIIITSSGVELKNISMFEGLCVRSLEDKNIFAFKDGPPSLEIESHLYLSNNVIHAHPKHVLTFLCCLESEEKIKKLYSAYQYKYIKYVSPGKKLSDEIKDCEEQIIFCQNHGIFVCGSTLTESFLILKKLDEIAKNNIQKNNSNLEPGGHLFPDSVVLPEKNKFYNQMLYNAIISNNLSAKFLTNEEIYEILNMEEEKYRRE